MWATALVVSGLVLGCTKDVVLEPRDGGLDAHAVLPAGKCVVGAAVDLLFVIDNSNSMAEEQASLAEQLPLLVRLLVNPPDANGDGRQDWLPITDLHLGVVSTDMGTGGHSVPTCLDSDRGDDGVLRNQGVSGLPECGDGFPNFVSYRAGDGDPERAATDFACVAQLGTGGCGYEQHLEAALKGVTPSTSPVRFVDGTRGHGDTRNAGFVREDSLLGVVVVSDEDDCSVQDTELLDPRSTLYPADLNLRCALYPEALHDEARYVDGLRALRADRPDLLAVAMFVGVPADLTDPDRSTDYRAILEDPRMVQRIDPEMPTQLVTTCETARGRAFPGRRLVSLAQRFEGQSQVHSICQGDLAPAASAVARLMGRRACRQYE